MSTCFCFHKRRGGILTEDTFPWAFGITFCLISKFSLRIGVGFSATGFAASDTEVYYICCVRHESGRGVILLCYQVVSLSKHQLRSQQTVHLLTLNRKIQEKFTTHAWFGFPILLISWVLLQCWLLTQRQQNWNGAPYFFHVTLKGLAFKG